MIYLTRRERFSAAHRMYNPDMSDDENFALYGPCSNPEWHGHNYVLYVTIKGEIRKSHGYLVNIKDLKKVINEYIIEPLDHSNINTQVAFMAGRMASTENLAIAIWNVLERPVRELGAELHCIKIAETENNYIEYYGE